MKYSSGSYDAFRIPKKIADAHEKHVYLIGGGLASLASAVFLIRDVGIPGSNITILEETNILGGAVDGIPMPNNAYSNRGGRELENHMECLWDLFRSIPSFDTPNKSVLDECYEFNQPGNISLVRAIQERGKDASDGFNFRLSPKARKEIINLMLTEEKLLENKKITDVFSDEILEKSNFWLFWRTMFGFENWHSALEMRRYLMRFIHHFDGCANLSAIKWTKYNQYESFIIPLQRYLTKAGVKYQFNTIVTNVKFQITNTTKTATNICCLVNSKQQNIKLKNNDYVFITNGSCVANSTHGNNITPAPINADKAPVWEMWKNIAKQSPEFGNPDLYCNDINQTNWMTATITSYDEDLPKLIQKICKRNVHTSFDPTGGMLSIKDSNWLMSFHVSTWPHYSTQKKHETICFLVGLITDKPGNYIKKPMKECNGIEIASELLYHIGCRESDIERIAKAMNTIPVFMPYITSFFMPRTIASRPLVVPHNANNFAFIGQFAETERDCVFTVEYSTRTAMEATYTLFNVNRAVPEVYGSCFDIRCDLEAVYLMADKKDIFKEPSHRLIKKIGQSALLKSDKKHKYSFVIEMLKKYKLFPKK